MRESTRDCVFREKNLKTRARIERWYGRDNSYHSISIFLSKKISGSICVGSKWIDYISQHTIDLIVAMWLCSDQWDISKVCRQQEKLFKMTWTSRQRHQFLYFYLLLFLWPEILTWWLTYHRHFEPEANLEVRNHILGW